MFCAKSICRVLVASEKMGTKICGRPFGEMKAEFLAPFLLRALDFGLVSAPCKRELGWRAGI